MKAWSGQRTKSFLILTLNYRESMRSQGFQSKPQKFRRRLHLFIICSFHFFLSFPAFLCFLSVFSACSSVLAPSFNTFFSFFFSNYLSLHFWSFLAIRDWRITVQFFATPVDSRESEACAGPILSSGRAQICYNKVMLS